MNCMSALTYDQLPLQSSGGETPLVHAIRIGDKDVVMVLPDALSSGANYSEDKSLRNVQTQTLFEGSAWVIHFALDRPHRLLCANPDCERRREMGTGSSVHHLACSELWHGRKTGSPCRF